MKKKYTIKLILTLSLFICFMLTTNAQIRLQVVNPSTNTVTIHNYGVSTVNISSYWLCTKITYQQLNTMTLQNGLLNLASGQEATVTTTTIVLDNTAADLGLYDAFNFTSTTAMHDFTQWGSANNGRESVAVSKGIWEDDTFISGAAMQPYTYTGDGTYNTTGIFVKFWDPTLSTKDFAIKSFIISPNPSKKSIQIQFPSSIRNANVEVFDILGKQIYYDENIVGKIIDVSQWSKGVYLIKATSNNKTKTKRFVKQ